MRFTILNVIIVIVVLIILYYLYNYLTGQTGRYKLKHIHNATQQTHIHHNKAPDGQDADYAYSIWFYISDWNHRYGEEKILFRRGTTPNEQIRASFDRTLNNLNIHIGYDDPTQTETTNSALITIQDVPLQKWTNLIVSANGRSIDVYLDGKLVKTMILDQVPKSSSGQDIILTPNGGFAGKTANFVYYNYALNPNEAYNIYREGAGVGSVFGTLFNKYRIKFAFMENNREVNSIEI